jgi:hypothetical protein
MKKLILDLIKADMKNTRLIIGLEQAGMVVDDFYTELDALIFQLMEFEEEEKDDDLFEFYYNSKYELINIDIKLFQEQVFSLSVILYEELLKEKARRRISKSI